MPVIVLSGVTGFLSAGSSTMFDGKETEASIALGVVSLFVGIINTVGTYFGWSKRAEGHRISSLHYAKLFRYIAVEMSLPRDERMPPNELLKSVRDQYERLGETSPMLPPIIIDHFKAVLEKSKRKDDISVPDEMNGIEPIYVYSADDLKADIDLNTKVHKLVENVELNPEMPKPPPGLAINPLREDRSVREEADVPVIVEDIPGTAEERVVIS